MPKPSLNILKDVVKEQGIVGLIEDLCVTHTHDFMNHYKFTGISDDYETQENFCNSIIRLFNSLIIKSDNPNYCLGIVPIIEKMLGFVKYSHIQEYAVDDYDKDKFNQD